MNKISNIRNIKEYEPPHDIVYTPQAVTIKLILMCEIESDDRILDPSKGLNGVFRDNLPTCRKDWCEIALGRDFIEYEGQERDIVIGDSQYSI